MGSNLVYWASKQIVSELATKKDVHCCLAHWNVLGENQVLQVREFLRTEWSFLQGCCDLVDKAGSYFSGLVLPVKALMVNFLFFVSSIFLPVTDSCSVHASAIRPIIWLTVVSEWSGSFLLHGPERRQLGIFHPLVQWPSQGRTSGWSPVLSKLRGAAADHQMAAGCFLLLYLLCGWQLWRATRCWRKSWSNCHGCRLGNVQEPWMSWLQLSIFHLLNVQSLILWHLKQRKHKYLSLQKADAFLNLLWSEGVTAL